MFIAALFIIARTWKQPRCPSADEWISKLWYIYTMEYYSAIKKNTFESVLMRWMKLEPIIQSEVSQKEKHQYSILPTFTFIKRLLSFSSLSAIRVGSSAYLRLLIFLPAILIPACVSSSPAFLLIYSAYKLNKQGDNIQPWHTPFPIWNQTVVPCPVLTVASWPAYRFLKSQIRWSGILVQL